MPGQHHTAHWDTVVELSDVLASRLTGMRAVVMHELLPIDLRDLPDWAGAPDESTVLAYRYLRSGLKLGVEAKRFDEAEVLARFKANTDDDANDGLGNDTLSVQTSRGRQSVRRFTVSSNRPIDPRRVFGSESSQTTERRERYMAMLGMVK